MMEMASNLKTFGRCFQVVVLESQIKSVRTNFGSFFFQNSFDFVS